MHQKLQMFFYIIAYWGYSGFFGVQGSKQVSIQRKRIAG
jgi:hypothetical protein